MMTENENILLKRLKEHNLKNFKTTNTEISNNENSKNISVKNTDLRSGEISQNTSIIDSQTVSGQIPLQRQYGNKKKFVINSPEKEETEITENQQTGKSVYYLINHSNTICSLLSISFFFFFFLFLLLFFDRT